MESGAYTIHIHVYPSCVCDRPHTHTPRASCVVLTNPTPIKQRTHVNASCSCNHLHGVGVCCALCARRPKQLLPTRPICIHHIVRIDSGTQRKRKHSRAGRANASDCVSAIGVLRVLFIRKNNSSHVRYADTSTVMPVDVYRRNIPETLCLPIVCVSLTPRRIRAYAY